MSSQKQARTQCGTPGNQQSNWQGEIKSHKKKGNRNLKGNASKDQKCRSATFGWVEETCGKKEKAGQLKTERTDRED